jgi:hypothetical protein
MLTIQNMVRRISHCKKERRCEIHITLQKREEGKYGHLQYKGKVGLCKVKVKSKLLYQRMWLGNDDNRQNFSFFVDWIVSEVGQLQRAEQKIKLVGEESELHLMGCVEAWQRWRTTMFLLLCRCLNVGVIVLLWLCAARLAESELLVPCVSSSVWMTLDGLNNTRARDFGSICCRSRAKAAHASKVSGRGVISLPPPYKFHIVMHSHRSLLCFTLFS